MKPGCGLPFASTQGELKVEFTMPSVVVFAEKGLLVDDARLDIVNAFGRRRRRGRRRW